jgi:hypothetical protein
VKGIVCILFFCFIGIGLTPLAFMNAPEPLLVCDTECCMEASACDMEDVEDMEQCPLGMCSPIQCIFCCFACPVTQDKIVIRVFNTEIENNPTAGLFLLSDFTSECWQPPELS